jgi:hypothetical protein
MTFHVLKSVYFGCMEFKMIVYIVVGLIWVFSKMLNASQKKKPLPPYQPANEVPPENLKPEKTITVDIAVKKLSDRTTNLRRTPVSRSRSLESVVGLESTEVKYKSYEKIETETVLQFMGEVQVLQDSDVQVDESYGAEIANEIKNGKMDWKRAVVINELLAYRH